MEKKLAEVRQILGEETGIRDSDIRETLWYYYFDVEASIAWLLGTPLKSFLRTPQNGSQSKMHQNRVHQSLQEMKIYPKVTFLRSDLFGIIPGT